LRSILITVLIFAFLGILDSFSQRLIEVRVLEENSMVSDKSFFFTDSIGAWRFTDSLVTVLQQKGFLEAYVNGEAKDSVGDSLLVKIITGQLYHWERIDYGNTPEEFVKKLDPIGRDYAEPFRWMNEVLRLAELVGYPFSEVKLDSLVKLGMGLSAKVYFEPGPKITWDSLEVRGITKTTQRYLQLSSRLVPGESFSPQDLTRAQEYLGKSPYYTLVMPVELIFQRQQAKPIFELRDRNMNQFDGFIGLMPNENEVGKMLVTGQVDLKLFHLGGKGRDFAIHWERLNVESQALEIRGKESFLFRSPLDLFLEFALLKQDSSFLNRNFRLEFGHSVSDKGYIKGFTDRRSGSLLNAQTDFSEFGAPVTGDFRWNQYGLGFEWNGFDYQVFPRKGMKFLGEFSAGNKKILANTAIPEDAYSGLEMNSPQYQAKVSLEKNVFVASSWGMYFRASGGVIKNENLFLNEYFRLGGLQTIRGFNEKFFFARSYGYFNAEQRFFFGENSFLVVFADFGLVENPYFVTKIDKPFSMGSGINLETGNGVFSFIYALGKSASQPMSFEYSRIHFGYLARF
jgi:outer membrane protein assembly factor BamA